MEITILKPPRLDKISLLSQFNLEKNQQLCSLSQSGTFLGYKNSDKIP